MSIEYPCVYHKNGWCYFDKSQPDACVFGPCKNETPSNGDKIRTMSDEELADQLVLEVKGIAPWNMFTSIPTGRMFIARNAARKDVEKWLKMPAEDVEA